MLWLAPRLEAAGYKVFADIFDLDPGDEWRGKLTAALQTRAIKMLLCCSDETLAKRGAGGNRDRLGPDRAAPESQLIITLKIRTFKKLFGIGGLQYVDFESGWRRGLRVCSRRLKGSKYRKWATEWGQFGDEHPRPSDN